MQYIEPRPRDDRANLLMLLTALDASPRALRRDDSGDWGIVGNAGHVYADGTGYLIVVTTGESARRWTFVKERLLFCRLTQDGHDEGAFHLDRLPSPHEASIIRNTTGIRKRRYVTAEVKATLANRFSKVAYNLPSGDRTSI